MVHSDELSAVVDDAESRISELSVDESQLRISEGATLIDALGDIE